MIFNTFLASIYIDEPWQQCNSDNGLCEETAYSREQFVSTLGHQSFSLEIKNAYILTEYDHSNNKVILLSNQPYLFGSQLHFPSGMEGTIKYTFIRTDTCNISGKTTHVYIPVIILAQKKERKKETVVEGEREKEKASSISFLNPYKGSGYCLKSSVMIY